VKKRDFSITLVDKSLIEMAKGMDQRILAVWATECAGRVLAYFEKERPEDHRPRQAIATLEKWLENGKFSMSVIRGASLASHAAARETGADNAARSAARSAGQAVATAHVKTHSIGASAYALQAVFRASDLADADQSVAKEREWQRTRLLELEQKRQEIEAAR
jgi:hypothetical protein